MGEAQIEADRKLAEQLQAEEYVQAQSECPSRSEEHKRAQIDADRQLAEKLQAEELAAFDRQQAKQELKKQQIFAERMDHLESLCNPHRLSDGELIQEAIEVSAQAGGSAALMAERAMNLLHKNHPVMFSKDNGQYLYLAARQSKVDYVHEYIARQLSPTGNFREEQSRPTQMEGAR